MIGEDGGAVHAQALSKGCRRVVLLDSVGVPAS